MGGSRRTFAAVGLVVALAGAGCGGTDLGRRATPVVRAPTTTTRPRSVVRNPGLQQTLLRSVSRTTAARSARASISVTLTGLGADAFATGAFDIAGSGVVDFANGDAKLSVSVPLFDRLGGGGEVEERIVRGVVYTKISGGLLRASGVPASVRWLSIDTKRAGGSASSLSQSQADPAGQLAFLDAISSDVVRVAPEPVRGVPTTRYAATIDLARTTRGARRVGSVREHLAALGAVIAARRLAVDVWLDGDGRARRIVVTVPLGSPGGHAVAGLGPDAAMRIQGDYYAFGAAVRVAAPPQPQVRPYRTLQSRSSSG